jgi:hypothetical protein
MAQSYKNHLLKLISLPVLQEFNLFVVARTAKNHFHTLRRILQTLSTKFVFRIPREV